MTKLREGDMDRERLEQLVAERDAAKAPSKRSYVQGRIDEYCAQNAVGAEHVPHLDLRLRG